MALRSFRFTCLTPRGFAALHIFRFMPCRFRLMALPAFWRSRILFRSGRLRILIFFLIERQHRFNHIRLFHG